MTLAHVEWPAAQVEGETLHYSLSGRRPARSHPQGHASSHWAGGAGKQAGGQAGTNHKSVHDQPGRGVKIRGQGRGWQAHPGV